MEAALTKMNNDMRVKHINMYKSWSAAEQSELSIHCVFNKQFNLNPLTARRKYSDPSLKVAQWNNAF